MSTASLYLLPVIQYTKRFCYKLTDWIWIVFIGHWCLTCERATSMYVRKVKGLVAASCVFVDGTLCTCQLRIDVVWQVILSRLSFFYHHDQELVFHSFSSHALKCTNTATGQSVQASHVYINKTVSLLQIVNKKRVGYQRFSVLQLSHSESFHKVPKFLLCPNNDPVSSTFL